MLVRLVGPGGAGKTSSGLPLAERLGVPFVDLDGRFSAHLGDISCYIDAHGDDAYAAANVRVYTELLAGVARQPCVLAISSGFMTYHEDVHPDYVTCRREIAADPLTFVLLPALDVETCVAETVRRQSGRPFFRSHRREELKIRQRFALYRDLPGHKVRTMRPVAEVVDDLAASVAVGQRAVPLPP